MSDIVIETQTAKGKTSKKNVVRAKRNGFGNQIKVGAVTYPSIKRFNDAFAKKWKRDPNKTYITIRQRIKANWNPSEAMNTDIRDSTSDIAAAAEKSGTSYQVIYRRMKVLGMTLEEAVKTPVRHRAPNGTKVKKTAGPKVETITVKQESEPVAA